MAFCALEVGKVCFCGKRKYFGRSNLFTVGDEARGNRLQSSA